MIGGCLGGIPAMVRGCLGEKFNNVQCVTLFSKVVRQARNTRLGK